MYIMPNLYRTILQYDRAIGPTLSYHKFPLNVVSYFYSALLLSMTLSLTLTVVVSYFTVFVDYILINLGLISLMY